MKDLWIDMTLKVDQLDVRLMDGNTVLEQTHVTVYELGKELSRLNDIIKEENDKTLSTSIINNSHSDYKENVMDTYVQALFNWNGRFARLQYFGYGILSSVVALVAGLLFASLYAADNIALSIIATLALVAIVCGYAYSNMAITAKRLHDLGYGAINVLWIWLLNVASGATQQASPGLSAVLSVVGLGVTLYLLFAPGNPGSNAYGDSPVAPAAPASGDPA